MTEDQIRACSSYNRSLANDHTPKWGWGSIKKAGDHSNLEDDPSELA